MRSIWTLICVLFLTAPLFAGPSASLLSVSPDDAVLRTIDASDASTLSTVTMTLAGETIEGGVGLATDPISGDLYALLIVTDVSGALLATVDSSTGVATSVGETGESFEAIAFDGTGTLFGVTGDGAFRNGGECATPETLYEISTADATLTLLCTLGNGDDGEALAFNNGNATLYHASGLNEVVLETIDATGADPCTVTSADVSETALGVSEVNAMTYSSADGGFLWAQGFGDVGDDEEVPTLYLTNADATVVSEVGLTDHRVGGLAFSGGAPTGGGGQFIRGDIDNNGVLFPLLDALYLLQFAFTSGPAPECEEAADVDNNGVIFGLLDSLYVLQFGFSGGPAPEAPFPGCGTIAVSDTIDLACATPPAACP